MNNIEEKNLTELIEEHIKEIPTKVRSKILEINITEKIEKLGGREELSKEYIEILLVETWMLALGITSLQDFIDHLVEKIELPEQKYNKIFEFINLEIIDPLFDIETKKVVHEHKDFISPEPPEKKLFEKAEISKPIVKEPKKEDPYLEPIE